MDKGVRLGEHRDPRADGKNAKRARVDDVLDELGGIDARLDATFGDEHADLPQADIADRERSVLAAESPSRPDRQPARLERVVDQDVRVNDDHALRSSARLMGS